MDLQSTTIGTSMIGHNDRDLNDRDHNDADTYHNERDLRHGRLNPYLPKFRLIIENCVNT